jgi:hypothetical protein
MIFTGHTPKLKADNHLNMLVDTFDEQLNFEQMVEQMIAKMELIVRLCKAVLRNNE